jgi:hypothetical protein
MWLFMIGWECKILISIATEFFNSDQVRTNISAFGDYAEKE